MHPGRTRETVIGAVIAVAVALIYLAQHLYPPAANSWPSEPYPPVAPTVARPRQECNLYDHPGRLQVPSLTWSPIGPAVPGCEAEHSRASASLAEVDRLAHLALSSYSGNRLPSYLSNRLLLVVGDSNDRNMVEDLCWNVAGSLRYHYSNNGSEIPSNTRAVNSPENLGDAMSCLVKTLVMNHLNFMHMKAREGEKNLAAGRRWEADVYSIWQERIIAELATSDRYVASVRLGDGKAKTGVAAKRRIEAAEMRRAAMERDLETASGARGSAGEVGAAMGQTWSDALSGKAKVQESTEYIKTSKGRRAGADTADESFAIVFVFNYGISVDNTFSTDHARPGVSPLFNDIVANTRGLLDAIATRRFPSLLKDAQEQDSAVQGGPTVTPSLIIAQSSLWELQNWRMVQAQRLGVWTFDEAEVEPMLRYGLNRIDDDLWRTYLPAFRKHFPNSPLAWRTCPPPGQFYKLPHAVVDYNRFMVDFWGRAGVRVLDWERIVQGWPWVVDLHHQSVNGTLAFAQAILAEMESIYGRKGGGGGLVHA
ncbi:hypothetical protein HK101_001004 [Irineochytrium annulatum]|nr:hypothetical protein HK101_001004 [Irineochytrium annulatum]